MTKKIKILFVFCALGMGLTGCIVVPDDGVYSSSYYSYSSYDPYPVGSYEWATDYYHRPPAPKPHHYKHHKSDHKYKKPEPKKPIDRGYIDRKLPDKKHIDKKLPGKVHGDLQKKPDAPKNKIDEKRQLHDSLKQNHSAPIDRKKVDALKSNKTPFRHR